MENYNSEIISKRICELRKEKELTQEDLANLLYVDKRKISRIEVGAAEPDSYILFKLSNVFNTSVDYLLGLTSVRERYPRYKRNRSIFKLFQR